MKFPIPFLPPFYDLFYGCSNQPIKASLEQRTYSQSKSYFLIFYLFHQIFPFSFLISLNQLKPSLISIWIIHFSSFVFWVLALKFIIITITLPLMKFYLFILPSTFTFSLDNIL